MIEIQNSFSSCPNLGIPLPAFESLIVDRDCLASNPRFLVTSPSVRISSNTSASVLKQEASKRSEKSLYNKPSIHFNVDLCNHKISDWGRCRFGIIFSRRDFCIVKFLHYFLASLSIRFRTQQHGLHNNKTILYRMLLCFCPAMTYHNCVVGGAVANVAIVVNCSRRWLLCPRGLRTLALLDGQKVHVAFVQVPLQLYIGNMHGGELGRFSAKKKTILKS